MKRIKGKKKKRYKNKEYNEVKKNQHTTIGFAIVTFFIRVTCKKNPKKKKKKKKEFDVRKSHI
jgi:hypothetical protein